MPLVTWGVVQWKKEKLVNWVKLCDYLKSFGIIPDELESLELPSAIEHFFTLKLKIALEGFSHDKEDAAGLSFHMGGKLELPRSEIVLNEEEHESDDEVLYRCIVSL
ncbi:hypothetical protein SLA2020_047030 [Shorea laevis]